MLLFFIEGGHGLTITLMQMLSRPSKGLIQMTEVAGIGPPRCLRDGDVWAVHFMAANGLEQGIGGMRHMAVVTLTTL